MTTIETSVQFVDSASDFHKINTETAVSIKDVTVSFKGSKGTFTLVARLQRYLRSR